MPYHFIFAENKFVIRLKAPYRKIQSMLDEESLEPTLGWGLRMAIATTVPLIWGIATGHEQQAEWVTLTADCIAWVALKGTYAQRLRILVGGAVLTFLFCLVGSITGASLWLSILFTLGVAFLASLFKNLGDRGSGLSICVYVMFLIANAHPVTGSALRERLFWVAIGGAWNALLGIATFVLMPVQQPYRRTIAVIWKASATLAQAVGKGWNGKGLRSTTREIYLTEKAVRDAIDGSFVFYEKMAHQIGRRNDEKQEYRLAQIRKTASLAAAHISAIHDEAETLTLRSLDPVLQLHLYDIIRSIQACTEHAARYTMSLRSEDQLLFANRIDRLKSALDQLQNNDIPAPQHAMRAIRRIVQLGYRIIRLLQRADSLLAELEEEPVFRSYSLIKTVIVLHPRHWLRNIRLLFNMDTHTFRYALRTAVAAAVAIFIDKWFGISHGYWLPFTVILVLQPYFGATLRKAFDRVIGTLLGGIAGGLIVRLPASLHIKEVMFAITGILMIYFFRRKYTVSAFFITLNLVLLFSVSEELNRTLIFTRALTTLGGALLAIIAGFALLPTWDRKYLPRHINNAIIDNWEYFKNTILTVDNDVPWTKYKRSAETKNSNAFDSFNRFMQEYKAPQNGPYRIYYGLISHNVRITREINNLHLERDTSDKEVSELSAERQHQLVLECKDWFIRIMDTVGAPVKDVIVPEQTQLAGSAQSEVYLERLLRELKALYESLSQLTSMSAQKASPVPVLK